MFNSVSVGISPKIHLFILLSFVLGFFSVFLCDVVGVHGIAEHDEAIVQELCHEICHHAESLNKIVVPHKIGSRILRKPSRERSEHAVISRDFKHGYRDIVRRFEGEFAVESKIPKHGENKRNKIGYPLFEMTCLIKQGVCCYLNNSRRGGEQRKFDSLKNVFLCAELLIFGSALRFFFLV